MKRFALSLTLLLAASSVGFSQSQDAEKQIRKALGDWIEAANRGDHAAANSIWTPDVVGWFPSSDEFTVASAFVVAGLPKKKGGSYSTYEIKIQEVAVSGSLAAVHDIWTETLHFDASKVVVRRVIRGSEMWRRQPDGKWKIARWVSAPEKWVRVSALANRPPP